MSSNQSSLNPAAVIREPKRDGGCSRRGTQRDSPVRQVRRETLRGVFPQETFPSEEIFLARLPGSFSHNLEELSDVPQLC